MKKQQSGFTLIELVIVIVILGILSAVAMPKFFSFASDARKASLHAALGAIKSTSAMVHGAALLNPAATSVTAEGTTVNITFGYPTDMTALAAAAGIALPDYTITSPDASPGSAIVATCKVTYTPPAAAGATPTFTVADTGC